MVFILPTGRVVVILVWITRSDMRRNALRLLTPYRGDVFIAPYLVIKHGLVECVTDWPYSTFHGLVKEGIYPSDWAGGNDTKLDYSE